jgi:hypothetical protein
MKVRLDKDKLDDQFVGSTRGCIADLLRGGSGTVNALAEKLETDG